jgi:hypothetical protein
MIKILNYVHIACSVFILFWEKYNVTERKTSGMHSYNYSLNSYHYSLYT